MPNARQRAKLRAAKAAAAANAKATTPCPAAAAAQAEQERIDKAYDAISQNGHAVQRHGEAITVQQLTARATQGIDPVTGTTNDAYNKYPNGSPKPHMAASTASKFNSKAAMVKADEKIRSSQAFKDELQKAKDQNKPVFAVKGTKLEDVFGPDYKKQVTGVTRTGPKGPAAPSQPSDFTDGTIRAVYKKDAAGNWNVETMFPETKPNP